MSGVRVNLTRLLDEQRFSLLMGGILALSMALMFLDGYDTNGIAFAAPNIARAWNIPPSSFGPVFAIGPVGMLIGGLTFGFLGDRYGRKPAIILSTLSFGIAILGAPFCTTLRGLEVVRFASGLGLGGLFPLVIVYVQEFMSRRFRSTSVAVANIGYSVGISSGGVVAAVLIPDFGWQVVFWLGGIAAMAAVPLLTLWMPESVKFLAATNQRPEALARAAKKLKPSIAIPPGAEFFLGDEPHLFARPSMFMLGPLFKGRLAWITPLLWICYVASSGTVFFLSFWGPTLVEALNVRAGPAAIAASLFSIGGLVAGLLIARLIDRFGSIVIVVMPLIASPLIAMLGIIKLSGDMYMPAMFVVGFFTVGGHSALHSIAGIFYPSACRSNGAGWALSISRLGTIGGPYLGGILLAAHMPLREIFSIAAVPSLVFASGIACLGLIHRRVLLDEAAFTLSAGTPNTANVASEPSLPA